MKLRSTIPTGSLGRELHLSRRRSRLHLAPWCPLPLPLPLPAMIRQQSSNPLFGSTGNGIERDTARAEGRGMK